MKTDTYRQLDIIPRRIFASVVAVWQETIKNEMKQEKK